jgi:crotonobetainyl-CoA:carnitine CoA-transferase CaiB-like acyl-CoA transferase
MIGDTMAKKPVFEGINVVDLGWWHAAPCTTKFMGDLGATVVKVESMVQVDGMRTSSPFAGGISGVNRSGVFSSVNSSKYSVAINLKAQRGIEIVKDLVRWADVVVESFTPRTMRKWGLHYDDLRRIKPDIIMCSVTLQGQSGPYASQPSLGTMAQALVGIDHLTGWPDRAPCGPWYSYTDTVIPPVGLFAIASALDFRRREGRGQHIDVNQLEAGLHFFGQVMLDYTVNGREQMRQGNYASNAAPHGVYRCKGKDKWCAISISTDKEWREFSKVIQLAGFEKNAKFDTFLGRKENEGELDKLVNEWTSGQKGEDVMGQLQKKGIKAAAVLSCREFVENVWLRQSGFLQTLEHGEMGSVTYMTPPFRLPRSPVKMHSAPCLGQDTVSVLTQILGLSDEAVMELIAEGVLE